MTVVGRRWLRLMGAVLVTWGCSAGVEGHAERVDRGDLLTEGIPDTPKVLRDRLREYQNLRPISFADWEPDSRGVLVRARFGNTFQFYKVERPLGTRKQVTFFDEPVQGGLYAPPGGPRGFLFLKDQGGDERFQLYFYNDRTKRANRITDGTARVTYPLWSKDGRLLCWTSVQPNSDMRRIYIAASDNPLDQRVLLEARGRWVPVDWSPDNRILLVEHHLTATESTLHLVFLLEGEIRHINVLPQKVMYNDAKFSGDGSQVYYLSDEGHNFRGLTRLDLASDEKTLVTQDIPWNVEQFDLSPDGQLLAFSINVDGRSRLQLRSLPDNRPLPVPDLPSGIISALTFSPDSRHLGFGLDSASAPRDAWSYDIRRKRLVRWTKGESGDLDMSPFVEPKVFRYPTFDLVGGVPRQVPGFYYRPKGRGPFPVVIFIHGGPESQFRPRFRAELQYWLNELEIAVVAPNVRGSAGYGRDYLMLDDTTKREDAVRDIGALFKWIADQPELDKSRVVAYGGSYGGYMVLASMIKYGDHLAGGIDLFGISNFVTFLSNTSPYRRALRRAEYGDERDPIMRAFLERISPLTQADRIRKPLFIVQGQNDPRVPVSESEQILEAVRRNQTKVWYMLAKNEGHGFQKKSNLNALSEATVMFLQDVLMSEAPTARGAQPE